MANAIYPKFKEALLDDLANTDLNDATVKVLLIDTANYTYSAAHQFLSDVAGAGIVATSPALANTTVTNGLFDADDVVFSAVTGASVEAIILFVDTGVAGTSRLVGYIDTGATGLPVTPNGGDINIGWNPSGIFQI